MMRLCLEGFVVYHPLPPPFPWQPRSTNNMAKRKALLPVPSSLASDNQIGFNLLAANSVFGIRNNQLIPDSLIEEEIDSILTTFIKKKLIDKVGKKIMIRKKWVQGR